MHRIEIPEINYKNEFAGKWEELKPEQVLYACGLLLLVERRELHPLNFKKLMIDRLLKRINNARKPTHLDIINGKIEGKTAEQMQDYWANEAKLAETMNFFFKMKSQKEIDNEEFETYEIHPEFTDNLVPKVKVGHTWLYGPNAMLTDLTFGELKECMVCCEAGQYNRLAAILYRPKQRGLWAKKLHGQWDGCERVEYKPFEVEEREKLVAKVSGLGYYCYLFFNSVLNYIYTQTVKIDGKDFNFSVLIKNDNPDSEGERGNDTESLGFTGIMYALAETGIFGDIEKTAKANIYDVFVSLYRGYLMNKELNKK